MNSKIIIATIMRERGETGVQTHFNAVKQYLLECGAEVSIITPFSFYAWLVLPVFGVRKILDKLSGELSVWWYRHWHYIFLKRALANKTRNSSSIVFYAQCPLSAKAALEVRHSHHQKVVMVTHFNVSQADEWVGKGKIKKGGWLYQEIKKLETEVIPSVDGIVYVSNFMKEIIQSNICEVTKVRSALLPYFIDKPSQSGSMSITGDLINIGTLEPRKNQSHLLYVLSEAKKLGKQYSLTLIGDGADRSKLEALARSLEIDRQVNFMGFQDNAAQFLPYHSVYAHSALIDNYPIVLIEAMACGLPILAAPVGGITEVFSDGVEGFYWQLDNPAMGAKKLIELMENSERRNQMAKAGQMRFYSKFESSVAAKQLLSFLLKYADN